MHGGRDVSSRSAKGLADRGLLVLTHLDRISTHEAIEGVPDDVPILNLAGDEDMLARRDEAEVLFDRVQ